MKTIFFVSCFISFTGFAQSLNRQLYERYFKQLFTYEPAMVRENKIESLEVLLTETREDSITYQAVKEKVSFRKDGRPTRMVKYPHFYRDSVVTDYRYDSIGNLIEYRQWKPDSYSPMKERDISHVFFSYEAGKLIKVLNYAMPGSENYFTLNFCDSISYSADYKKATIRQGNMRNPALHNPAALTITYPAVTKKTTEYTAKESELAGKPVDKESCWKVENCSYSIPALNEIQRLTKTTCLPDALIRLCGETTKIRYTGTPVKEPEKNGLSDAFALNYNTLLIDTLRQMFSISENTYMSIPTSLENREVQTNSLHTYDFSFRLLETESFERSHRGQRENSQDSSQTIYTYFDSGLLRSKTEIHRNSYFLGRSPGNINGYENFGAYRENNPVIIFEDQIVIKTW